MLNKDITQIIEVITSLGIKADMVTNGKLLTKEKILELRDAGLKRIRLSIDGFEEHELFRKGSDPNELWDMAQYISSNNIMDLCIHTVCSSHNVNTLFGIYKKVLEVKANRWRVFDIGFKGSVLANKKAMNFDTYYSSLFNISKEIIKDYIDRNNKECLDMEINHIFRTDVINLCFDEFKNVNVQEALVNRLQVSPCEYISHQLSVRSNGIGTFCQFSHSPIFDFKKYEFNIDGAVENGNNVVENEIVLDEISHCKNCKYVLVCNSGCRSRAEAITKDAKGADPVCCYIQPLLYKEIVPILPEETQKIFYKLFNEEGNDPKYSATDLENLLKEHDFIF